MTLCRNFLKTLLVAFFVLFTFPAFAQNAPQTTEQQDFTSMNAAELQTMMKGTKPFFLLDVRRQDEFDAGHLDGAHLIPLDELQDRYAELPKDETIIVYCRSGHRSGMATAFLHAHGYSRAVNLGGGYMNLTEAQKEQKMACRAKPGRKC